MILLAAYSNPWFSWSYVRDHTSTILATTVDHVELTLIAVGLGLAISLPLGVLAHRRRRLRAPVYGATSVIYSIPALALFVALVPETGIGWVTAEIGLVAYTLVILVRNVVVGLAGVPGEVRDAARGMGLGSARLLFGVELPLALPAIMAGVRVATVSTIALTTVAAYVGVNNYGTYILEGLANGYRAEAMTYTLACVALAVIADLLLLGVQRAVTPWVRAGRRG